MTTEAIVPAVSPRRRVRAWLRGYAAMVRWEVVGSRLVLPLLLIVQVLAGAGFVIGFGMLIPDVTATAALYLSTGAVVMSLILLGLIVAPQIVAQQKMEGSYEYVWSLPVPRSAATMASVTLAALIAVPGIVAALLAAVWRYDVTFTVDPAVVPACLLTLAAGSLIGASLAHGIARPELTMLLSQLLIFVAMGFSPINFPIERLPGWLAALHDYLPIHHMAILVRGSLTEGLVEVTARSWVVLSSWTVLAATMTATILVRRK